MALITDPDNLSQGAIDSGVTDIVFGTPTGAQVTITSAGANFPSIGAGDYFEIRDHSDAENNGLYKETGGTPSSSSVTADKITGSNPVANAVGEAIRWFGNDGAAANEKSVMFDTQGKRILLLEQGNLSTDGVTLQALYSFAKEEWKDDNDLIPFDFPFIAITPEQFEFIEDWEPRDITSPAVQTRKLIRTAGWAEIGTVGGTASITKAEYIGAITLGTFEDAGADTAYYAPGSDATVDNTTAFDFAGPVNESILVRLETGQDATGYDFNNDSPDTIDRNDAGSFITDGYVVGGKVIVRNANTAGNNGTYAITAVSASQMTVTAVGGGDAGLTTDLLDQSAYLSYDNRSALALYLRVRDADPNGKTYGKADLAAIGVSDLTYQAYRFPLANVTDLKISETDANISANSPYTQIVVRYFDQAFSMDIDTPGTQRNFGIVVDVGTHSGVDGVTAGGTTLTSAEAGIPASTYDGGTLIIHEGTDKGTHTITTASGTTVNLSAALSGSESNLSFTLQRSTPVVADAEEIYEKIQYLLRQATDIDSTDQTIIGKTADELLRFVGNTLEAGASAPSNPNGGGSGVAILGFDSNDTNRLTFYDNTATDRQFPFVAAGTISFSSTLVDDTGPAEYTMFFEYTERFTNTGFGLSAPSGDTATLDSSVTNLVSELADGDYIALSGFTNTDLDGIYVLTATPSGAGPWSVAVRRVDGTTLAAESAGATVSLDKNPIGSPDAIIVDNNAGSDITGTIGASSVGFDFDYDGNTQGGRTAGTNAAIVIRAIGLDSAQFVETSGTITRATGLSFSLVAGLERNYSNP